MRYGFHGPNLSCSTACAASSHAIHEGFLLLTHGLCDIAIVGGADSSVTPFAMAAFNRCKAVTTKFNDNPGQASRPFDRMRSGFVMGEGAGVLVLETEEHARKRGVTKYYAQLVGCSATSDAYHVTAVEPSGQYIRKCMTNALAMGAAVTNDSEILQKLGYVNAHATSTPVGDGTELKAILECLNGSYYNANGEQLLISSTKGSLGHLLGGTGAVEACFAAKVLAEGIAPPTINLTETDDQIPDYVSLVPGEAREVRGNFEYALSNSFGFGGTNASLLFKKV
jgi:3-oxoacyl-[acyl-carrier-protein] synthase II